MRVDAAGHLSQLRGGTAPAGVRHPGASGSFASTLAEATGDLRLSRHAEKRIDRRALDLDGARLQRLNSAVGQLAAKGARNGVVMLDDLAMVVDVRERTVVTALQREEGRQRVFTNVDSVVIA